MGQRGLGKSDLPSIRAVLVFIQESHKMKKADKSNARIGNGIGGISPIVCFNNVDL
jgi:hypothetical protein